MDLVVARPDPALSARLARRTPLLYDDGPAPDLDRSAHVRAGSSLARVGSRLIVVQDDANWLALVEPAWGSSPARVGAVPLPEGEGGRRLFDSGRGTKHHKLDFEACLATPDGVLLAFGSGSSPRREKVAVVRGLENGDPAVELRDASALYAALRDAHDFSGSELNVEGALFLGQSVRLFGRGNGAARDGRLPLNATCDLGWPELWAYLEDPGLPPPQPEGIVRYDLGWLGTAKLGFTDATLGPGGAVLYSASAEDSPDATADGDVLGSALGVISGGGARWAELLAEDGSPYAGKVEGVALKPGDASRAWVVVDSDDWRQPSELGEVELGGPWF